MKLLFLSVCFTLAAAQAHFDYHKRVGIPLARKIKEYEQRADNASSRVHGGTRAKIGDVPFQAGLIIELKKPENKGQSICGAVLVSKKHLLTHPYCWSGAVELEVVLGSDKLYEGGVRQKTKDVLIHPKYVPTVAAYLIAIVKLPSPVEFSDSIRAIALPQSVGDYVGAEVTFSGFGKSDDHPSIYYPYLRMMKATTMSLAECRKFWNYLTEHNICTDPGPKHAKGCAGDEGGPVYINEKGKEVLIALVILGGEPCSLKYPTIHALVSPTLEWIQENIKL